MIEIQTNGIILHFVNAHSALRYWVNCRPGSVLRVNDREIDTSDHDVMERGYAAIRDIYISIPLYHQYFPEDCLINGWKYIHDFDTEKRLNLIYQRRRSFTIVNREEAMMLLLSDEMVVIPCQSPGWREARRIIERVKKDLQG